MLELRVAVSAARLSFLALIAADTQMYQLYAQLPLEVQSRVLSKLGDDPAALLNFCLANKALATRLR